MHIKIHIEGAPDVVNAALADDGEYGRYGNFDVIKEVLIAAVKARANQTFAELDEVYPPCTDDLRRMAEEVTVISAYIESLNPRSCMNMCPEGMWMTIGSGGKAEPDLTKDDRERATGWMAHKVYDEIGDHGDGSRLLRQADRWLPVLRSLVAGTPLTDRDLVDIRAVVEHWRGELEKELSEPGQLVPEDRVNSAKDLRTAERIIASIDVTERVTVDV